MNLKLEQAGSRAILYDADSIPQPVPELFDPGWWRHQGRLVGEAAGRGRALLLDTPFGPAVLRPYRRGGWAARISRDRYGYTGLERSRPMRETRMLARLRRQGLPVPEPLAGLCQRHGLYYTGALLTRRIEPAETLADRLESLNPANAVWAEAGKVIRRLHEAGVVHADLNARNVLVGSDGSVHVLDFDRARIAPGAGRSFRANLERLKRSLVKLWPEGRGEMLEPSWERLVQGYGAADGRA